MPGKSQQIIFRLLLPRHLILQTEMLRKVLPDHLLLPVRAGIIDNDTDKREIRLLYAETIQGILDEGRMVIRKTLDRYLKQHRKG